MSTIRKPQEYARARELRKAGWALRPIAAEVNVHWTTVQGWTADVPSPFRHRLSDVDEDTRTAVCNLCGPVSIRKNGCKNDGTSHWRCGTSSKSAHDRTVAKAQERFYAYISTQHCVDCENDDPLVLEFDHVRGKKQYNISDMVRKGYGWTAMLAEIAKCEVVCANCHKIRTNERNGWFRWLLGRS